MPVYINLRQHPAAYKLTQMLSNVIRSAAADYRDYLSMLIF